MSNHSFPQILPSRCTRFRVLATTALGVVLTVAVCASNAPGQTGSKRRNPAPPAAQEVRQATLKWLDRYLVDSSLISAQDIKTIHQTVANMSDSQLRQWLDQTKELRTYVESDEWQETKKWLRAFLKVQAIYSDEEINQLRDKLLDADADQMLEILKEIQKKHEKLSWMHRASDQNRSTTLKGRNEAVARQAAAAKSAASSTRSKRPLFGNTPGYSANRQKVTKGYQVPRPLITSREVARWSVFRAVW